MSFFRETFRILQRAFFPALAFLALGAILDQALNLRLEQLLQTDDGPGSQLWVIAGLSLLSSFVFPLMATFFVLYGLGRARGRGESFGAFVRRVLNQLAIETLRSWGAILSWGFLFIVPGIVRFVQLTFIPFVVAYDRNYDENRADALAVSTRYARRYPVRLIGLLLVFVIVVPLVMTNFLDPWKSYDVTPIGAFFCTVLDVLVLVISLQIFYRLFERARKELGDESLLQLEANPATVEGSHV